MTIRNEVILLQIKPNKNYVKVEIDSEAVLVSQTESLGLNKKKNNKI